MIVCPSCGTENAPGSNFCSNCGTKLVDPPATERGPSQPSVIPEAKPRTDDPPPSSSLSRPTDADRTQIDRPTSSIPPQQPMPAPVSLPPRDASGLPATAPEWRMSSAGPLPEPRGRRRWLWITLGILGACLLVCVVAVTLASTVFTDEVESFLATQEAEATARAGSN